MTEKILSDIEIAQQTKIEAINNIAGKMGIPDQYVENYGKYKAKIDYRYLHNELKDNEDAKLILVTAITPTPAGEGKTTTTIGLRRIIQAWQEYHYCTSRTFLRSCFWCKRRGSRRGIRSGCTHGRYKSALYRRFPCNRSGKQSIGCNVR